MCCLKKLPDIAGEIQQRQQEKNGGRKEYFRAAVTECIEIT